MKKITTITTNWWVALLLVVFAAGCGGGGGGGPTGIVAATVSSTTPANNVSGVAMNSVITATFSKAMDPQTIDATTFTVAGVTGTVSYDATSRTAIFTPSGLTADSQYTATVTTRAKDLAGDAMAANYTWSFTTGPDTKAPTVDATTPAKDAGGVAVNSVITATFHEAMDPATITTTVTVAGVTGTVSYDAPNRIAIFTPTSNLTANTTYTATITTGVKDLSGIQMAQSYSWSFTTGTESIITPPTVLATIPAKDATGVATNSAILITFSKEMDSTTITTATITIAGVTGTVSYNSNSTASTVNGKATFTPSGNLAPNTTYTATISTGAKDLEGHPLAANYTWSFITGSGPDTTPPTVISNSASPFPQPNAANVPVTTNISITFSEPMSIFSVGTIDGNPAPVTFDPLTSTVATMTPTSPLKPGTPYIFTIRARDSAGNLMDPYKWSFTTQP